MTDHRRRTMLSELARLFLRLGATAVGGPAVHIAMMEDEVVRRRGWLTRDEFLDLLGATNPRPQLHRTRDPHRSPASWMARSRCRGRLLHPPRHADRACRRLGLRAVWPAARSRWSPVWREA